MKRQMVGVAAADLRSGFGREAWTQLVDGPVLAPELPWERDCIEAPSVCRRGDMLFLFYAGSYVDEDGDTHLFYQGNDGGRTWFLSRAKLAWRNGRPYLAP